MFNFNVRLKTLLREVLSGPKIYGDLIYKLKKAYRKEWCVFQGCSLLTFDISELPFFFC